MKLLSFLSITLFFFYGSFAQSLSISGKVDGLSDGDVLLGYYYGDKQYVKDTVQSVNGSFIFQSDEALEAGMYFMLLSDKNFFQLIIDSSQVFSFHTSVKDLIGEMKIIDSKENTLFYNYQQFTQKKGIEVQPLKAELKTLDKDSKKRIKLENKIKIINEEVATFKADFLAANPEQLFAKILLALEPISIPESPILESGVIDSTFQYIYFKRFVASSGKTKYGLCVLASSILIIV